MSKFRYELELGKYDESLYVSIDIRVDGGLLPADYQSLREHLNEIEAIARFYEPKSDKPEAKQEGGE